MRDFESKMAKKRDILTEKHKHLNKVNRLKLTFNATTMNKVGRK